jgi:large subunit ribosomal protein L21
MSYAIIRLAGKQYRVQEGDHIVVDRLGEDEGKTFHPDVLLFSDNGKTQFAPKGVQVTAKVVSHQLGEKVRIGKYRPKSGYRRHTGYRSKQSEIEIQKIGASSARAAAKPAAEPKPKPPGTAPAGTPAGYADMTVAQVKEAVPSWTRSEVEDALAYENENAKRKGAIAALEAALKEEA